MTGRVADAILQPNFAYAAGHQAPMVDLQFGGQMGYAQDLTEWVSNQAYVRRNMICLLVEAPKAFQLLPNPEYWIATLRALVELHPMSIDGLNAGLEVETIENPFGGGGQMQHDFTNVTETQSVPVFRWNEKYGMPISSFLRGWITNLLMDPNSKFANIATLGPQFAPGDMLADMYTATMAFIEPDPTHTRVVKSWLVTNMFPKGTGDITGRRDLTQAGEAQSIDVTFTGIAQFGLGVDYFCQQLLSGINLTGANPHLRPAFVDRIDADILAARKGYEDNVETLGAESLRV
jgi:hypothetical protein